MEELLQILQAESRTQSRCQVTLKLQKTRQVNQNYFRLVLAVTISLISASQYYFGWTNYNEAIKCLSQIPKYKIQAMEIAKSEGLLKKDKKADRGKSKDTLKEEEDNIIRQIISEKMDIKGGYARPNWTDVLWVQLVILPYTLFKWTQFYLRWLWKFGIKREDYGLDEKLYVIRSVSWFLKAAEPKFFLLFIYLFFVGKIWQ